MKSKRTTLSAEELWRLFSESVTDYAFITFDRDNRVTGWSKGAESILGYSETEALELSGNDRKQLGKLLSGRNHDELPGQIRVRSVPRSRTVAQYHCAEPLRKGKCPALS